jgi:hypothetical protein
MAKKKVPSSFNKRLKHSVMRECKAHADEKTEHTKVCEYFEEACNTAIAHHGML